MEEFLKSVYESPPDGAVVSAAVEAFAKMNWHSQDALVGAVDSDIEELYTSETQDTVKVLMRAAARLANASPKAKLEAQVVNARHGSSQVPLLQSSSQPSLQGVSASQIQDIVGPDYSAATLAKLLSAGNEEIDVAKCLGEVSMSKLPYHLQCDKSNWKILDAENKAAQKAERTAFAYVDLTAKEVLPIWLPADAIGGKPMFGTDWNNSDASSSSLAELGQTLQAATSQRKLFRSIAQSMGAFIKYAATAIPMSQMACSRTFAYLNTIMKIHEEMKQDKYVSAVAIVYDDVFRKTIARRAEAKDPELDLDEAFAKTDARILEACKTRIGTAGRALPLRERGRQGPNFDQSKLEQQTVAAEAAASKAEAATRSLNVAQLRFQSGQYNADLRKRDAKRNVWLLGTIAESRTKKVALKPVFRAEEDDDYEDEEEFEDDGDEEYGDDWGDGRANNSYSWKGSKGSKKGSFKGWKSGKGKRGKGYKHWY